MVQRPIGPVAVFGASNFPLAFSTAGGDTAAALAAGCPVVVKGHSAYPGISDFVSQAIEAAIKSCDLHPGVFCQFQGGNRAVGTVLVQLPFVKAVGFAGSLAGGRALLELCASWPEPILFFGELGSVNPVFILDEALETRGIEIANGWAAYGQRLSHRGRSGRCHGAWWTLSELDQFRRHFDWHALDPPVPAAGVLSEPAESLAVGRFA